MKVNRKNAPGRLGALGPIAFTVALMAVAGVAWADTSAEDACYVLDRYPPLKVLSRNGVVSLENTFVRVSYDLTAGTYSATDLRLGRQIITGAGTQVGGWSSTSQGVKNTFAVEPLSDALGLGRSLLISSALPDGPILLLRISLYPGHGFIALEAGLENCTTNVIQLKQFSPLTDGQAFGGFSTDEHYSVLDGNGGGADTYVSHAGKLRLSKNNLLVTFGRPGAERSLVLGGLSYAEFEKSASAERQPHRAVCCRLWAADPVGKRIDSGTRYLMAKDRFYVDFMTDNPFTALENYANFVRLAQPVELAVCAFPIEDTWFAQVPHFGGGEERVGYRAQNDSIGAVEEMECVAHSGFLKYAQVGILLEPDLYDEDNQQGWWDDAHWQRGPDNRARHAGSWVSSHGQFVPPYETTRKWAGAVKALGGIPMIYVQTGFRSEDFASKYPGFMLFNQPAMPFLNSKGEPQYRDKEKRQPRRLGYDYTDPGFVAHVRETWENLRLAGVQGVKFDYPDYPFTGWPTQGGMEDQYSTTAMFYRDIFRLAKEGLGPDCYLHERTLERGSDVTVGLVTSQRTEGDTDRMNPKMVSRVGLRWYKNRVIMNYDMDGKNPFHADPANRDGERAMWTMSYIVGGSLIVVPSFGRMTPEQIHDLSRIYPFHSARQSPRPVDAFLSPYPRVYDFEVNAQWHELTFYNTDPTNAVTIAVDLAGDTAFGSLGLDPKRSYYFYDFWNNQFLGKFTGTQRFEQTLRPGEARMMSVHEVEPHPQFLSSDRHIMQGYVDLLSCNWNASRKELAGVSSVVGGEACRLIIAANGYEPQGVTVDATIARDLIKTRFEPEEVTATLRPVPGEPGLLELVLKRASNGVVAWVVR